MRRTLMLMAAALLAGFAASELGDEAPALVRWGCILGAMILAARASRSRWRFKL